MIENPKLWKGEPFADTRTLPIRDDTGAELGQVTAHRIYPARIMYKNSKPNTLIRPYHAYVYPITLLDNLIRWYLRNPEHPALKTRSNIKQIQRYNRDIRDTVEFMGGTYYGSVLSTNLATTPSPIITTLYNNDVRLGYPKHPTTTSQPRFIKVGSHDFASHYNWGRWKDGVDGYIPRIGMFSGFEWTEDDIGHAVVKIPKLHEPIIMYRSDIEAQRYRSSEYSPTFPTVNGVFSQAFDLEHMMILPGMRNPTGTSLCAYGNYKDGIERIMDASRMGESLASLHKHSSYRKSEHSSDWMEKLVSGYQERHDTPYHGTSFVYDDNVLTENPPENDVPGMVTLYKHSRKLMPISGNCTLGGSTEVPLEQLMYDHFFNRDDAVITLSTKEVQIK